MRRKSYFIKRRRRKTWIMPCGVVLLGLCLSIIMTAPIPDKEVWAESSSETSSETNMLQTENPFASFPFYQSSNQLAYEAYQSQWPAFTAEDVVWRVNSGLNRAFYTEITEITDKNPLLVNKYNKLPESYIPEDLVEISKGHLAASQTEKAFTRMRGDVIAKGMIIDISSAYRSIAQQHVIYNWSIEKYGEAVTDNQSARPGHSEHHTGRALDITGSSGGLEEFVNTPEAKWVMDHASEYGFIIRYEEDTTDITGYRAEPWHITYVGNEIALEMKEKNIKSLEEYAAKNPGIMAEETAVNNSGKTMIVIDAGHGGEDPGCIRNEIEEKDINLEIAKQLKSVLERKGYGVYMTRSDDNYPTKLDRVEMANGIKGALFVSIHQNAFEDAAIHGIETWYDNSDTEKDSYNLARLIHSETLSATGAGDRELREDTGLYVTRETNMPACLIETGYITNDPELALLKDAGYQQKIAQGIGEGIDLFLKPKVLYLTFDDGPSAKNTDTILDILKTRNIKATFFLIGANVRKYPEVAKRIVAEGHTIGIHCNSHVYKKIYASVESYINDFNDAYSAVVEVTGVEPRLFRFPGGSINAFNKTVYQDIIAEMSQMGFVYFDWNLSIEDAVNSPDAAAIVKNAKAGATGKNRVVLLAHDNVTSTAQALGEIIDLFPEYQMETLTEDTKPVQFTHNSL